MGNILEYYFVECDNLSYHSRNCKSCGSEFNLKIDLKSYPTITFLLRYITGQYGEKTDLLCSYFKYLSLINPI